MEFTNEELDMLLKLAEAKSVKVGNPEEFDRYVKLATKIRDYLEPSLIPDVSSLTPDERDTAANE